MKDLKPLIWKAYAAALGSKTYEEVAASLGIGDSQLARYRDEEPEIEVAIKAAWDYRKKGISPVLDGDQELRELWKLVTAEDADTKQKGLMALSNNGDAMRQKLLLYALDSTHFDLSRACKALGISKQMLARWSKDPLFLELAEEIEFRKKNFIETALLRKVGEGSEKATIFASQTLLKDRGYGLGVQITGQINHVHGVIDLGSLELEPETKLRIVEAVQASGLLDTDGLVIEGAIVGED